ncbi:MAG TPA: EndoU domain-containing protein [Cytophagaceae bacterium]
MNKLKSFWIYLFPLLLIPLTTFCQSTPEVKSLTAQAEKHILEGEINARGKAVGAHHITAVNSGNARIIQVLKKPNKQKVYEVQLEIYDFKKDQWVRKENKSSFFPDDWSREQVKEEIINAFNSKSKIVKGNKWEAISPSGIKIAGYINERGEITTAYPLYY